MSDRYGFGYFHGDAVLGYGDPHVAGAAEVILPTDGRVSNDGGERVVLVGAFPEGDYRVRVGDQEAYSGVSGRGPTIRPARDGRSLAFIVPSGLPLGPAQVYLTGAVELEVAGLHVVRHCRRGAADLLRALGRGRTS